MADFDLDNVDSLYLDVLKEVGNIGAGNAATSIAQLLGTKVDMKVPRCEILDFDQVGEVVGGADQIMAGIYLLVQGDITGSIMFMMSVDTAHLLVSKMMGMPTEDPESFTEMEQSALKEIGNIITGSYLNSLSTLTGMKITESIPDLTVDMAEAILSVPAIEFGMVADKMLMIQTAFTNEENLDGYFVLVPDLDSYGKLLQALGVMPS